MYYFSANDDPHGIFKLQPGAQKIRVTGNSRLLQFTVQREKGTFGAVDIQYEVQHSEWYPSEMKGSVTVPNNRSQVLMVVCLILKAFCSFFANFANLREPRNLILVRISIKLGGFLCLALISLLFSLLSVRCSTLQRFPDRVC